MMPTAQYNIIIIMCNGNRDPDISGKHKHVFSEHFDQFQKGLICCRKSMHVAQINDKNINKINCINPTYWEHLGAENMKVATSLKLVTKCTDTFLIA
jgi:hypothetical protein